jgi:hypothetical protein
MRSIHFVLLCVLSARCLGQPADHTIELGTTTDADGVMHAYSVSTARLENTPAWAPGRAPVPFSLERALAAARPWLLKRHPPVEDFAPTHFTLSSVHQTASQRYWAWHLQFNPIVGGRTLRALTVEAFVLLDGSIVEPRVSKGSPVSRQQ